MRLVGLLLVLGVIFYFIYAVGGDVFSAKTGEGEVKGDVMHRSMEATEGMVDKMEQMKEQIDNMK
ncbi:MAG: hypothetical protein C0608_04360 [Deltaproteobacteria bacterium]|nr:MAG: hypothetical protein C0608_04360 [Deltaproteobacteria bacterium]